MKKVVYSVTKVGKFDSKRTGLGYVVEDDLIIACLSKGAKPYIRVFDDCKFRPIPNSENEFKGTSYQIHEVDVEVKDSQGNPTGSYEKMEIDVYYDIWFKILD